MGPHTHTHTLADFEKCDWRCCFVFTLLLYSKSISALCHGDQTSAYNLSAQTSHSNGHLRLPNAYERGSLKNSFAWFDNVRATNVFLSIYCIYTCSPVVRLRSPACWSESQLHTFFRHSKLKLRRQYAQKEALVASLITILSQHHERNLYKDWEADRSMRLITF